MKRNLIVAAVVLLLHICLEINTPANAAGAISIPIKNPGFEEPALTVEGDYTTDTPPGWTTYDPNNLIPAIRTKWTSSNGVGHVGENYGQFFYNQKLPEGQNIGFVYLAQKPGSGIAGFEQTLDTILEPNTKYTLTVHVGNFGGVFKGVSFAGFPGYRVELLAGDKVMAADNNSVHIKDGEFKVSTVTFTAKPNNPYLGQKLGIRLINLLEDTFSGLDFDNLSLTAEPVDI